ncbi:helix-turn-helix domain-containing protein [Bacillus cereus group sp. BceL221]|uniref:helix-turn-helix domain-containing protein n=1 Tax=unclassified Bacillus cereus group TaxID=2750818 RepID=UPI0022E54A5B|nr:MULTISPECIES: helix-turn-helix transcriptional regulator [unclassified Bacillus cereus group]MDA2196956.1 helix-turn-helix transcriptional regulator [Bacillus cereus group sp. Bc238]MDA2202667.1 helix-turn-helix transcriptional regulator [Bacillus cereus group sp. Bc237]
MLFITVEREKKNWSKAELARRARLDQGLISKIESGRIIPYQKELERLSKALNVPTKDLLIKVEENKEI